LNDALAIDHLVVAAANLDDGARWCEAVFGVAPGPGGRHAAMSTHNRLLHVGSAVLRDVYLEIIAVDPQAPPPGRARWFGLDTLDLSPGPRLVHWAARTPALDSTLADWRSRGVDAGRALDLWRDTPTGRLSWRLAVRDDGQLVAGGAWPTPIEWASEHPARRMPASPVVLRSLTLRGVPRDAVRAPGVTIADDAGPALQAVFDTPRGPATLRSA
jgi:Glyoxalase-like domain